MELATLIYIILFANHVCDGLIQHHGRAMEDIIAQRPRIGKGRMKRHSLSFPLKATLPINTKLDLMEKRHAQDVLPHDSSSINLASLVKNLMKNKRSAKKVVLLPSNVFMLPPSGPPMDRSYGGSGKKQKTFGGGYGGDYGNTAMSYSSGGGMGYGGTGGYEGGGMSYNGMGYGGDDYSSNENIGGDHGNEYEEPDEVMSPEDYNGNGGTEDGYNNADDEEPYSEGHHNGHDIDAGYHAPGGNGGGDYGNGVTGTYNDVDGNSGGGQYPSSGGYTGTEANKENVGGGGQDGGYVKNMDSIKQRPTGTGDVVNNDIVYHMDSIKQRPTGTGDVVNNDIGQGPAQYNTISGSSDESGYKKNYDTLFREFVLSYFIKKYHLKTELPP